MVSTLFYIGIPVVGIIAIAYAVVRCIKMRYEKPEKMDPETEEFMVRFILKLAGAETLILVFSFVATAILWRSATTMEPDEHVFICGVVYLVTWLDMVMMAFTFALTYQLKLSREGQQ